MSDQRCDGCRWWRRHVIDGKAFAKGRCFRFPPHAVDERGTAVFPVTTESTGCGEWTAKRERIEP